MKTNEININNNNTATGVNEMESEEELAALKPPGNTSSTTDNATDCDEVDYVPVAKTDDAKSCVVCKQEEDSKSHKKQISNIFKLKPGKLPGECEVKVCVKNNLHTLDKLQLFKFRKRSDPSFDRAAPATQKKPKFVKSMTIAKLFGNNYNPKNSLIDAKNKGILATKPPKKSEKFHHNKMSQDTEENQPENNEDTLSVSGSSVLSSEVNQRPHHHAKPFKTLSRSFGKLLRRNYSSVDISIPDPEYKVSYLGNVLTGWARGDNCMEKPLSTLWRNYTQNNKPDVLMRLLVSPSGLKASTRQHGLTEYWAHRITFCSAPKNYPRVFCWIYRHEGRKLKHELRCHAVICSKESIATDICNILKENLAVALKEFKREKVNRQNARLSLANSVYDNPSMPRRKIMLSVGGTNYRPPLERSKSAPKLMAIEEAIAEEEEDETEAEAVKRHELEQMKTCCKEDSLFPVTTLGRRRCRRGHSIRRSRLRNSMTRRHKSHDVLDTPQKVIAEENENSLKPGKSLETQIDQLDESRSSEEDFDKFLAKQNYESSEILSGQFLAYLNHKLNQSTNSLHNLGETESSNASTLKNTLSLDNLDDYSDDSGHPHATQYFDQQDIMEILSNNNSYPSSVYDDFHTDNDTQQLSSLLLNTHINSEDSEPPSIVCLAKNIANIDSDEGSISSGCETSSTMTTATNDEKSCSVLDRVRNFEQMAGKGTLERRRHDSASCPTSTDNMPKVFVRSVTIPAPGVKPNYALPATHHHQPHHHKLHLQSSPSATISNNNLVCNLESIDSDSELSDESGYVEFQENNLNKKKTLVIV
ncbi:uncharacterized protein LOC134830781 [Culicoides brevitarsis]|uniref:uncharacterized protein LOC134830781 n=1 Tax=Culicoides brevitarsis TaxID=469753 RepID=UPI00307B4275